MNTSQTIRKFAGKIVKKNDSQNAITLEIRESRKQTAYFNAIVPSTQYSGVSNNELTKYIFQAISSLENIEGLVMANHPDNENKVRCFANNHNKQQFYDFISKVKIQGLKLNPIMK